LSIFLLIYFGHGQIQPDLGFQLQYALILIKRLDITAPMAAADERFMKMALGEASAAGKKGEVPVGAVLIDRNDRVLSKAHNLSVTACDATAHAEILVLRKGGQIQSNYRLLETTLYVTIEPCVMCMGAIIHARVKRLVYGAPDPKWGAAGSLYDFGADTRFNHRVEVKKGVCETECRQLIQEFFRKRRSINNHPDKPY